MKDAASISELYLRVLFALMQERAAQDGRTAVFRIRFGAHQ